MTPTNLLIMLALVYFTVTIVDWVLALTAQARVVLVLILLVLYTVWIFGLPMVRA